MSALSFQYPIWFAGICLLAGLVYALTLYFRDQSFKDRGSWLNWLLGILRFLAITAIGLLLLGPLLKSFSENIKKPIVVLAQDNSESILANFSEADKEKYIQDLELLQTQFGEKYDLKTYSFGANVREGMEFTFDDKVSNLSQMVDEVYELYNDQNLGAVVISTDGIYNEGSNPLYTGAKLTAPVFTIALGDTTPQKDLIVKRVYHNKIAYLGDKFSIQVDVSASNCLGAKTNLQVTRMDEGGSQKLKTLPINVNKKDFFATNEIILEANRAGVQRYRISLNTIKDEASTANNAQDIFIEVLDARQKILLLANSPHPDIAAIKSTLSKNKNYEITVSYADQFKQTVAGFDFVVLHQLPSATQSIETVLKTMNDRKIPRLFVVGNQSAISAVGKAQGVLSMSGNNRNTNDAQAIVSGNFNLFTFSDQLKQVMVDFPPVVSPFGEFKAAPDAQTLLFQRIGKVDTEYPLLVMGEERDVKVGVFNGEGIWRWRIFDYLQHQNHELFDEMIGKTIQYLSVKEDKRKFRVTMNKNVFKENEAVSFDAELYNETYELVNDPDVSLSIKDEQGKEFNYTFNKTSNAYNLDAGVFPVGNFRYTGTVVQGGNKMEASGKFSVRPIQLEKFETTADHGMLKMLSDKMGGGLYYPNQINDLSTAVLSKDDIKPTIYSTLQTQPVIYLKWIFFLVLFLLAMEWFIRRYNGGY